MIDLTPILGKPFRAGARGPDAYDCVGVAAEVVRGQFGDCAAETLPNGLLFRVEPGEFPGEWVRVPDTSLPEAGDIALTERINGAGVEHHVYACVSFSRWATCDRKRGVCVVPTRALQREKVIGMYRYGGEL